MLAVTDEFVEHNTDSKEVGGDVPSCVIDVRRLVGRRPRHCHDTLSYA